MLNSHSSSNLKRQRPEHTIIFILFHSSWPELLDVITVIYYGEAKLKRVEETFKVAENRNRFGKILSICNQWLDGSVKTWHCFTRCASYTSRKIRFHDKHITFCIFTPPFMLFCAFQNIKWNLFSSQSINISLFLLFLCENHIWFTFTS